MNAEVLILSGILLIVSGAFWLASENKTLRQAQGKQISITEIYRNYHKNYNFHKYYIVMGVGALLTGGWIWWLSDRNIMWTILWLLTCLWYIRMKRSVSMTGLLFLGGAILYFYNLQLGLIWLLTVIGLGYFDYNLSRETQPMFAQIAVVLNPVGALGKLISLRVPEVKLGELTSLEVTELPNESIVDCPVCKTAMKLYKTQDGEEKIVFDQCPKCRAVFFDEREHLWAIRKMSDDRLQMADNKKQIYCPRCEIKLKFDKKENFYYCSECWGNLVI